MVAHFRGNRHGVTVSQCRGCAAALMMLGSLCGILMAFELPDCNFAGGAAASVIGCVIAQAIIKIQVQVYDDDNECQMSLK